MNRALHDSELLSIELISKNDLKLSFREPNGTEVVLLLKEILFFLCNEFKERNIVFEVKTDDIFLNEISSFLELAEVPGSHAKVIRDAAGKKPLKYVTISSSYGAKIKAVCMDIQK